jgi:hypothetical protein
MVNNTVPYFVLFPPVKFVHEKSKNTNILVTLMEQNIILKPKLFIRSLDVFISLLLTFLVPYII